MISFKSAEFLMRIIVVLLVYFVTAPLTGYFRAWVSEKMGDSTPSQLGFLSLNPMTHISMWWVIFIIWIQTSFMHFTPIALGKYIPINPHHIHGKWRGLKLAVAYLSDSLMNIILGIVAFFILIATFKTDALLFIEQAISLRSLTALQPQLTSLQVIMVWVMATFALFNCLVAAFSVISNLFNFVMFYYFEDLMHSSEYAEMILIFGPLLLLYLMVFWVWSYVTAFVISIAYLLGMLVGVV